VTTSAAAPGDSHPDSVVDSVAATIERLEASDLGAVDSVSTERALHDAAAVDARRRDGRTLGPVDGLVIGVKATLEEAGRPLHHGCGALTGRPAPTVDCATIRRLRNAGAIVVASTTMSEFGWFCSGHNSVSPAARNPWNRSLTPGGSSSGSAAAVAGGLVAAAIGTDGGGSVRTPAAYCSLVGFKPSADIGAFDPPRDANTAVGPLTWTVADAHALTEALSGRTIARPAIDAADLRVTVATTFGYGWPATDAVLASVDTVAAALAAHGATVTALDGPVWPHDMFDRAKRFGFAGFRSTMWPLVADRLDECTPTLAHHLLACATITDAQAAASLQHALDDLALLGALLESCDVLITPTQPTTAHGYRFDTAFPDDAELDEYGYTFDHNPFTFPFNYLGAPAISLPVGTDEHGLPIGVQIAARPGQDGLVLATATHVETLLDLIHRPRPTT